MNQVGKYTEIIKIEKGRWGTTHWIIKGLNKGSYQRVGNIAFDSYEDAEKYLLNPRKEHKEAIDSIVSKLKGVV